MAGRYLVDIFSMTTPLRRLNTPHIIGAVVTCGTVLGIASMIHPTDSAAVPAVMPGLDQPSQLGSAQREPGTSLGELSGRGFSATIEASYPEAIVFLEGSAPFETYEGLTIEEYLLAEPELAGDQFEDGLEAWPEALMEVDIDSAPW